MAALTNLTLVVFTVVVLMVLLVDQAEAKLGLYLAGGLGAGFAAAGAPLLLVLSPKGHGSWENYGFGHHSDAEYYSYGHGHHYAGYRHH